MLRAGLLLNNLSVYRGCEIVFDSSDVPDEALSAARHGPADVQAGRRTYCIAQPTTEQHMLWQVCSQAALTRHACALQVDLSPLQQQLQVVRDAPADADIAPSLTAISDLLGQVAVPDAAAAAACLVAEVAEGRAASGEAPVLATSPARQNCKT